MSLWTSLEPASTTVDPGGTATTRLRLRNTGDVVDEYRFRPVGTLAPWTSVEPATLRLYPGTTGTVELTFSPPRTPDAAAGPHPYGVQITPTEHPEATTVPEGNVTVTPFTEIRAELVPPTVRGRFRGRPRLAVDNLGNTKMTASVSGSDNGSQLSYDIHPSNVQIEPGRAAFVKTVLKPRQITWFGASEDRPYTLGITRSGDPQLDVDGTYVQKSFLPGWLATLFGVLLALALTFVMLWITYAPKVRSLAQEKQVTVVASQLPELPEDTSSETAAPAGSGEAAEPDVPAEAEDSGGSGDSEATAECAVHEDDGRLYCSNTADATGYEDRSYDSAERGRLETDFSWFECWGHGEQTENGNDIWYWTKLDNGAWGNIASSDLSTEEDPVPGLDECS
ncbi:hydrolase [Streptomyces sp. AC555_RSS877]|uniref:COG1470 family protein n=1 Tax=Streptomyces sp. AC555_RSS877 TaxID=2823688 RepID=UPI0027E52EC1|nr:hydrolase [Streptomyces sp. AC555_RSS877]